MEERVEALTCAAATRFFRLLDDDDSFCLLLLDCTGPEVHRPLTKNLMIRLHVPALSLHVAGDGMVYTLVGLTATGLLQDVL